MAKFLNRKQLLFVLLTGLGAAAAIILLVCYFEMETRLNIFFDYLLKLRQSPPVSNEIVLIETGEAAEGGDVFDVLMALSEFDASSLIIAVPVLGISSDRTLTDEEIRQRLNDEYSLLGRNIRNFFDAIRMGLIKPIESQYYVDNLVDMADRGKERLAAFLLRDSESGAIHAARTSGVFATVLEAADLGANLPEGSRWYSRPRLDFGGKLRRVAPILPAQPDGAPIDHIVYAALKPRWAQSYIEDADTGQVLVAGDFRFPLDHNGNIIVEKPHSDVFFRSISIDNFRLYAEADLSFRRMLKYAEALGAYSSLRPERIPLYWYDHALALLDDLLKNPAPEKHTSWLHARREYWKCLDEFLGGDSEERLLGAYNRLIMTESARPDSQAKLEMLRDDFAALFEEMRVNYLELTDIRSGLETALNSSFCIMGPPYQTTPAVEASALLANTLLTGHSITPAQRLFVLYCSLAVVFFLLIIIHALPSFALFLAGTALSLLCSIGFGWSFMYTGYWLDPLIPSVACMAGTIVMACTGSFIKRRKVQRFRFAYGGAVNAACLKQLVQAEKPSLDEVSTAGAAVIAVRNTGLLSREDSVNPLQAVKAAADFRAAVTKLFLDAGATLIGCEGGMIMLCFGSPLERIYLGRTKDETGYCDNPGSLGSYHPVNKAAGFISSLIAKVPPSWCFGIDYGECAFIWSSETGFTANGRPVVRARILASLAPRYKARIIITNTVREKISQPARKLHVLGGTDSSPGEVFYELPV